MQRIAGKTNYSTAKQSAFSLIEILISLFIFTIALLGLLRLQWIALQQTNNACLQQLAEMQLESITERLFINPQAINEEANDWNEENRQILPDGNSRITGNNPYQIQLTWCDSTSKAHELFTEITL